MDYYTIDFETANENLSSACSIGIVGVVNNKKVYQKHILINPLQPFNPHNVDIHHITYEDVCNERSFDQIWDEIKDVFNNTIVFAHNSLFDFKVLESLLDRYKIKKPHFKFGCTVKLARKLWPNGEVINHRLNTLSSYLGVSHNHHDALSDASICVDIINRGLKMTGKDTVMELYNSVDLIFGNFDDNFYNTYSFSPVLASYKIYNEDLINKVISYTGKHPILKKKDLDKLLYINGAFPTKTISNKADVLVLFDGYSEQVLNKALEINKKGNIIKIINKKELDLILKYEY